MKRTATVTLSLLLASTSALAHCPLCTAGAAMAAGAATYLGVSQSAIGVFIGAFAISIGLWFSKLVKKDYVRGQRHWLMLLSFATTVPPMLMFMQSFSPFYINLFGDYGSLLNRTYLVNNFLVGSVLGGLIVWASPAVSRKLTELRQGRMLPYQGMSLMFVLLIVAAVAAHLIVG